MFFHSLPHLEWDADPTAHTDPAGRIAGQNFNEETKRFILRDLRVILGPERVWTGHAMPHSTSSVFIFCQATAGFRGGGWSKIILSNYLNLCC